MSDAWKADEIDTWVKGKQATLRLMLRLSYSISMKHVVFLLQTEI